MLRVVTIKLLMHRDKLWLVALFVGSVPLAFGLNALREAPLSLCYEPKEARLHGVVAGLVAHTDTAVQEEISAGDTERLSLVEFDAIRDQAVVLDARSELLYKQGHVPGALSLPRKDFYKGYERIKVQLAANRERVWVVYCSGLTCTDAAMLQTALRELRHTHVRLFSGGWTEWTAAGRPQEVSP